MKTKKSITERIKTYEDACRELGIPVCPEKIELMSEDELAYYKLKVIVKALNEGWVADWTNRNERKYYPYFEALPSDANCGLSSSHSILSWTYSPSVSGSRLAFKSKELSEYAGKQFTALYEKFLI